MPSDRIRQALLDIRENAELAQSFISGMSLEAFTADRRTYYATLRCLEIVSEASRRLDDATRARHPGLPWRAIMGSGNIYRHEYDNLGEELVLKTVQDSLPPLISAVTVELNDGGRRGE